VSVKVLVERLEAIEFAHDTAFEVLELVGMPRLYGHANNRMSEGRCAASITGVPRGCRSRMDRRKRGVTPTMR
jgi:hypothetical protein